MSFDEIFDLTAGVYFHFYNIRVRNTSISEVLRSFFFFFSTQSTARPGWRSLQ